LAASPAAGFAAQTVTDWLDILAGAAGRAPAAGPTTGPTTRPTAARDDADATLLLAVLRGGLLDLLATGEQERVTAAVTAFLDRVDRRS
jgi:hypothetical protein